MLSPASFGRRASSCPSKPQPTVELTSWSRQGKNWCQHCCPALRTAYGSKWSNAKSGWLNTKHYIIEGSLEVKLPTIWRDQKAVSREKSQKRKDQKKEDAGARKGRKVAKNCVFSWFCGSGGLKSRLAKAAGAETSGEMRDKKLHAVVARSRFRSEKVQNTSASDHFWKLRCWKSARHCGAKHISKSKC